MNAKILATAAATLALGAAIALGLGQLRSDTADAFVAAPAERVITLATVTVTPDPEDMEWVERARAENIPVLPTINVVPSQADLAAAFATTLIDETGRQVATR